LNIKVAMPITAASGNDRAADVIRMLALLCARQDTYVKSETFDVNGGL